MAYDGLLYVTADLTTKEPANQVEKGAFVDSLAAQGWTLIAEVSNPHIIMNFSNNRSGRVDITGMIGPTAKPNDVMPLLMGGSVKLLWENSARDERTLFTQVSLRNWNVQVTQYNHPRMEGQWEFDLLDRYEIFVVGQTTRLHFGSNVTYTAGPSVASWPNRWVLNNTPAPAAGATGKGSISDLVPGRLRGYREWKILPPVGPRPARLASITANTVWPWTPTMTAQCHRADLARHFGAGPKHDPAEVPHPDCTCGIYAKHRPIDLDRSGGSNAFGIIEAWGRIELGTNAFRAQHARLVALYRPRTEFIKWSTGYTLLDELAAVYKVPIFTQYEEAIQALPPSDISSLLG